MGLLGRLLFLISYVFFYSVEDQKQDSQAHIDLGAIEGVDLLEEDETRRLNCTTSLRILLWRWLITTTISHQLDDKESKRPSFMGERS
jgi:hypothetical protein